MRFFSYLLDVFYPNVCIICKEGLLGGEEHLCLNCINKIPKTHFQHQPDNLVEQRFWGKVEIESGSSLFFFSKGSHFQQLLHELKYKNNKNLGHYLGKLGGVELANSDRFKDIDYIIPVPLHPKKEQIRGYNQSQIICEGIADILERPTLSDNLIRIKKSDTQTKKSVYERYKNMEGIFTIKNGAIFANKHILLVDDVLTTGSTMEGCIQALKKHCSTVKVSVFTIAIAV